MPRRISDYRRQIKGLERSRKIWEGMYYKEVFHFQKILKQHDLLYKTLYRITEGKFIMSEDSIKVLSIKKEELGK